MTRTRRTITSLALGLVLCAGGTAFLGGAPTNPPQRENLRTLYAAGNYKEAYDGYRALLLESPAESLNPDDLKHAVDCLRQLGRISEFDELVEAAVVRHAKNWRLLAAAGEAYYHVDHHGFIVAGRFQRGQHRGGGEYASSVQRDRARALQLMRQARELFAPDADQRGKSDFYLSLARILLGNQGYYEAWRLQVLTDLSQLPDYDRGWHYGRENPGAPVDAQGRPVFYHVPATWEAARSDGERWRWALLQAMELEPQRTAEVRWQLAQFCESQFGVQTLAHYGWFFGNRLNHEDKDDSGTYALHTLAEHETIARLATGVKRFELPDEFNAIRIYQQLADEPRGNYSAAALETLAQTFENRRQYEQAASIWRRVIKEHSASDHRQQRLLQIVDNWGRFEAVSTQPAGKGATVEYRFRNSHRAAFTARQINVEKLLTDVKNYARATPRRPDWQRINLADIGYRLVQEHQNQYVGRQVAQWEAALEPTPGHVDRRVTITTPLQDAGAYLVTAQMPDGNTSQIVLWVADTVIVHKPVAGKKYYYVSDASTGQPIAGANVEFFGFAPDARATNFAELTDADGQVVRNAEAAHNNHQWLITARTRSGRLAFLGFSHIWNAVHHDEAYDQTKVYTITDRPVYRPGQEVKFKFWIRQARYDQAETSSHAKQSFNVDVRDPQGDAVHGGSYTTDAYGGIEGSFTLPSGAKLGNYHLQVVNHGGGSFRVEEYKKPEFEVAVEAPKEPVMLGERITATIRAKYYFGSPVTDATVKYKVQRTTHDQQWYPVGPWDWLYGPGYWWYAYDYNWYPGWLGWGCRRPIGWWWGGNAQPPEVVADAEVPIGPDGTVQVEIDTALAKEIHGDHDHQYQITAEVVDASRRTIVGTGNVLVARKPFQVFAWVDRGYYRAGDTIHAQFSAHSLDRQPIAGKGRAELFRITYDDQRQPVETSVQTWDIDTNAQGQAALQLTAGGAGQYRLAYRLTDTQDRTQEGAYVFTVIGAGAEPGSFRFNQLELVADQREYHPGDEVKLLVNTDRPGSTVLLFLRPANGAYLPPKVLRMQTKSTIVTIPVVQRDMPNFFVEAVTVSDAQVHTELKEIFVPPEQRVLNVAVEPSQSDYKPGQKATVRLKLTDFLGKPFVGSTVLAIYDKSVEYIAGGSNVPEIREFFWKWRRSHHPQSQSSLERHSGNQVPPGQKQMADIGAFGGTVAEELGSDRLDRLGMKSRSRLGAAAEGYMPAMAAAAMPGAGLVDRDGDGVADFALDARASVSGSQSPPLVQPTIRQAFADTALWAGSLATDADGTAEVSLTMPENLTTWKVKAWGMGHGTQVGEGAAEVVTRKDLIVRLQAPRFFVEKDEVVLSANIHNYLSSRKQVQAMLELEGETLALLSEPDRTVEVDADGETRVDWRVKVLREGQAIVRMKALTDEESDAVQQSFPVYVHGMLKTVAFSGALRPEDAAGKLTLDVPAERRINDSRLEVRWSPTLAGAMVDALPYLADYPYGCTEQTLSRFLPTVITQKILLDMQLDLAAIRDKRTNLNAQEIGDDAARAAAWKRFEPNPVFDEDEVRRMAAAGVQRLTDMQLSDGGWGWFSGWNEHSAPHTTAYVVHGLQIARQNDVALVPGMLERGVEWLKTYQTDQVRRLKNAPTKTEPYKTRADNIDAFVYMVLADSDVADETMRDFLYRDRTELSVYAKAMFGLALHKQDRRDELAMILRNIEQFLVQDEENQTAWLKMPEGSWWYWYGSEYEAHAYYLKLLARTNPRGLSASRLAKYLVNNRKHATYWNSTRDTALCIEALADYMKASGEARPDLVVEVWLDGRKQKEVTINAENLFTFDNRFVLIGDAVETGQHTLELRKRGQGPLYYNAYLTNFTLEDQITAAGLELKVARKFYQLLPLEQTAEVAGSRGQAVKQQVEKYERRELANLAGLQSGDLVEVELEIDSKNDYEYLFFEDMKAAGFEPVGFTSGYNGNALGAYVEFRDERVSFFVRQLARGQHSVAYRLRAEIPGSFSALPTRAEAMYAPELRANSDEIKLVVED